MSEIDAAEIRTKCMLLFKEIRKVITHIANTITTDNDLDTKLPNYIINLNTLFSRLELYLLEIDRQDLLPAIREISQTEKEKLNDLAAEYQKKEYENVVGQDTSKSKQPRKRVSRRTSKGRIQDA